MANDHRNGVPAGLVKRAIAAAEHDGTVRWTDGSGGSMCSKGCRSIAAGETPAGVVDQRFIRYHPSDAICIAWNQAGRVDHASNPVVVAH